MRRGDRQAKDARVTCGRLWRREAEGVPGAQRGPLGSEREVVLVSEAVNGTRPVLSDVLGTVQ